MRPPAAATQFLRAAVQCLCTETERSAAKKSFTSRQAFLLAANWLALRAAWLLRPSFGLNAACGVMHRNCVAMVRCERTQPRPCDHRICEMLMFHRLACGAQLVRIPSAIYFMGVAPEPDQVCLCLSVSVCVCLLRRVCACAVVASCVARGCPFCLPIALAPLGLDSPAWLTCSFRRARWCVFCEGCPGCQEASSV